MAGKRVWWKWLLLFIAGFILFLLAYGAASIPMALDEEVGMPLWLQASLCVLSSAGVLGLYALWWKWTEQCRVGDLPMRRLAGDTGLGFGIGIIYFIVVTGFMALVGGYRAGSVSWDWNALARDLFAFLVVAVGEEVLFRGIVFRMIDDQWGTAVSLIASALIFGFVHIGNDNATVWSSLAIAIEAGLLLAAAYKWSGTLWLPIGIHWSWNYFQGPVFGFAVSGNGTSSVITPVIQGSDWLTGGSFGAEASIPALVLGLALAIVFLYIPRRTAYTSR